MQKLNEKKILGTVPKKLQLVENFWDCPEFSENKQNQKGITLIALIITIIVMLILVGVTINVALNGGLFEKGEKAAFQTEASTVKEQLEMAKALKVMENGGKLLDDYSGITFDDLTDLDEKTIGKYENKIVVAKNGDICYNPANVTDQEKTWLEEIGIKAYVNTGVEDPEIQEPTRVPFTNYIEEGNNYYIYGDKTSDYYEVIEFSREQTKMTIYYVEDGQINDTIEVTPEFIDKNEALIRFEYTDEMIQNAVGVAFNEISDDIFIFFDEGSSEPTICVFKENYLKLHVGDDWYELDTTYRLPTNAE